MTSKAIVLSTLALASGALGSQDWGQQRYTGYGSSPARYGHVAYRSTSSKSGTTWSKGYDDRYRNGYSNHYSPTRYTYSGVRPYYQHSVYNSGTWSTGGSGSGYQRAKQNYNQYGVKKTSKRTWGDDHDDEDSWGHDDEDSWGHDDEDSWGHDDEDSWGHDSHDNDSWGHNGKDFYRSNYISTQGYAYRSSEDRSWQHQPTWAYQRQRPAWGGTASDATWGSYNDDDDHWKGNSWSGSWRQHSGSRHSWGGHEDEDEESEATPETFPDTPTEIEETLATQVDSGAEDGHDAEGAHYEQEGEHDSHVEEEEEEEEEHYKEEDSSQDNSDSGNSTPEDNSSSDSAPDSGARRRLNRLVRSME